MGGLFTRYESSGSSVYGLLTMDLNQLNKGRMTQNVNQFNYGGYIFFDITYVELAVSVQGGKNKYNEVMSKNRELVERKGDGWEIMLGFSFLAKYPFNLFGRFKLFPIVGMEYQHALMQRRRQNGGMVYDRSNGLQESDVDDKPFSLSDWNSFWVLLGAGTDFSLMKNFFLRGELLYGFRLMNSYERDGVEQMKTMLSDNSPKLSGLTSGPSLRLSAGYRFWNK